MNRKELEVLILLEKRKLADLDQLLRISYSHAIQQEWMRSYQHLQMLKKALKNL